MDSVLYVKVIYLLSFVCYPLCCAISFLNNFVHTSGSLYDVGYKSRRQNIFGTEIFAVNFLWIVSLYFVSSNCNRKFIIDATIQPGLSISQDKYIATLVCHAVEN